MVWRITLGGKVVPLSLVHADHPIHSLPSSKNIVMKNIAGSIFEVVSEHPQADIRFRVFVHLDSHDATKPVEAVNLSVEMTKKSVPLEERPVFDAGVKHHARVALASMFCNHKGVRGESLQQLHAPAGKPPFIEPAYGPDENSFAFRKVISEFLEKIVVPENFLPKAEKDWALIKEIVKARPDQFDIQVY